MEEALNDLQRQHRELVRISTATSVCIALAIVNALLQKQGVAFHLGQRFSAIFALLALCGVGCNWLMAICMYNPLKRLAQGEAQENGGQQ